MCSSKIQFVSLFLQSLDLWWEHYTEMPVHTTTIVSKRPTASCLNSYIRDSRPIYSSLPSKHHPTRLELNHCVFLKLSHPWKSNVLRMKTRMYSGEATHHRSVSVMVYPK